MEKVGIPQHKSQKTRLIVSLELLKTFTENELVNFDDYINCNYHNTNKKLCLLFKKLRQYALKTDSFSDEVQLKIYQDVIGKAKNQKVLNTVQKKDLNKGMNHLLNLAESFLMVEQLKQKESKQYELLFPQLINRKQMVLYNRRLKTKLKEIEVNSKRGIDYHMAQYNLQVLKAEVLFLGNKMTKEDDYDTLQYYLDSKYIIEKLKFHLAKITLLKRATNKRFDLAPYKAIQSLIKLDQYKSNPLIHLYLLNIDLVEKSDDNSFQLLIDKINQQQELIPTRVLKTFYINLTSYCADQITKGRLNFYDESFSIYKKMHQFGILTSANVMPVRLLKNIITIACRVEAFNWAKDILIHYIDNITKDVRNSVLQYNLGIIEFNQQNYSNALIHFNQVLKIDDTHDIGIRISRLKCFYEIDQYYEITTQKIIDNIKVYFCNNKKLTETEKTAHLNFISAFNKLYKFKHDVLKIHRKDQKIKKAFTDIKQVIYESQTVKEKQWLTDKMKALQVVHFEF